ncbi:MAG: cation:proton antiporter [Maricaulaceae bacterium]|jgi:NhaP-type Na+/H+ or K+/H+ antiporter
MDLHSVAIIAIVATIFALISKRLETSILTPPLVFTAVGLAGGAAGLGWVRLEFDHGVIHGLAEFTLVIALFADAARIDLRRLRADHSLPVRMLFIGMPLIILAGVAAGLALPLGLGLWETALLAAILAPTDAALGQAVAASPLVPVRVRQALNVESGLNDGIALPVVLVFAALASFMGDADGERNWLVFGALQVSLGPAVGVAAGFGGGRLIDWAAKREWMSEGFEGAAVLGLAILAFAGAELVGGNGFIAAFTAGLVFGDQVRGRCRFLFEFAEAEGQILVLVTFLIFGAALLPDALGALSWPVVVYALLSLSVVRLAPIALSLVGLKLRLPTIVFLGWFGPRGLASILFAIFVLEDMWITAGDTILTTTLVTVALSILLHGVTAAPAARWYGALASQMGECVESKPVAEMRTRTGMVEVGDKPSRTHDFETPNP